MPTIKHGSTVNKTDFWSQMNSPEQPIFARKFLEFLELYFIFFHEILHTDAKWPYLKCDGARFLKNILFLAENAGNMPEKPFFFWPFLEISSLVFSNFLHKDAY